MVPTCNPSTQEAVVVGKHGFEANLTTQQDPVMKEGKLNTL
jgi:hypothetical protein